MAPPSYGQLDEPGDVMDTTIYIPIKVVVSPTGLQQTATSQTKKTGAIVCGIIQILVGVYLFCRSMIKVDTQDRQLILHGYLSCMFNVLAGMFGIQSGQRGGVCPAITSMVLSILGSIVCFSAMMISVAISEEDLMLRMMTENQVMTSLGSRQFVVRSSSTVDGDNRAIFVVMLLPYLMNFIAAIVQAAFACAMTCCRCEMRAETGGGEIYTNAQYRLQHNVKSRGMDSHDYQIQVQNPILVPFRPLKEPRLE